MRISVATLILALAAASPAVAASTPQQILDANRAATGGSAWDDKAALKLDYAYAGQGMTGTVESLDDLKNGNFADSFSIGPATGANGYDGKDSWAKDPSGTVTIQDGGNQLKLSINEAYRRANMWWQPGFGGADVKSDGQKTEGGNTYDVLTITPRGGKAFDAWFDASTHLLSRTVEAQEMRTVTTTLSDYREVDGVRIAYKAHTNEGDVKYDQDFTLTSAAFVPEPAAAAFAPPKVDVADYAIAGGTQTSFPFHLYNNHIYADVNINGKGPYQFVFDTGGVNLLTPPLVSALGLHSEGKMQGGGAGSGHMDVGLTKVAALQLGNATVKDQIFAVMELNALSPAEGVPMPGMIGFETFRRFVTRVDYGTGTITLIDPKSFDPKDAGAEIAFNFDGNTVEIPATFNGVPGTFTLDTGSRASLTLNRPFAAGHGFDRTGKTVDAVTGWGVGGPSRAIAVRGDVLKIGPYAVKGPVVEISTDKGGAFVTDAQAGNIGAGILKRFIVTLDYGHQKVYIKPVTTPVADLDTFDRSGMWINEDGNGAFKVVDVTKGAPAESAGLKAGDIITAVNGKPSSAIHLYELRRDLRNEAPGTVVTFTVKSGGATRDVKVTLRDLI